MPQTSDARTTFECANPILSVAEMARSLRYYVDVLGFTNAEWGTDDFTCVSRDDASIYLSEGDQGHPGTWVWVGVGDVDVLHEEYKGKGATILHPPANFPWACEMKVGDPDGHVLRFGSDPKEDLRSASGGSGRSPVGHEQRARSPVVLRLATANDSLVLAEHRVAMFREMGAIKPQFEEPLRRTSAAYFEAAIPIGEYVGWIAYPPGGSTPIAGAGVQVRSLLPRPTLAGDGLLLGREGLVLNVYTVHEWRRRGVARHLMDTIIAWASEAGIVRLVLSASPEGRPLYEQIGFAPTREMSYAGPLASAGPWTGAP